jgi:hypothetical protein
MFELGTILVWEMLLPNCIDFPLFVASHRRTGEDFKEKKVTRKWVKETTTRDIWQVKRALTDVLL